MRVFHTVEEVVQWRTQELKDTRSRESIGFVPTMGCLHSGHASLISKSVSENTYTVVSIFVNPSQFAPTEDLDNYPRTLPDDIKMLESLNVDVLFAPNAHVMYPQGIPLNVEKQRGPFVSVLGLSEKLEGETRPNFFRGVATVVTKLFNIVMADVAYFGQKDIQQFIVLQCMVDELFVNTKLQMMPIVRNSSGLALSSRNKYLCPKSLKIAENLYRGLKAAEIAIKGLASGARLSRSEIIDIVTQIWAPYVDSHDFKIDYISLADFKTLDELSLVENTREQQPLVISCAVYVTDRENPNTIVRLIDNIVI
ncbi:pantoate--beta-alanine ligase PAN6 [Saccharomyces eubayanus]|uniref:pantoate--beta-alanine ligase PAN6 n=1 Tax=Saccharomyces eubayanus TaxID=1080349 RepID=UPI0006C17785|nr:PAN6-like protein [Saccharomyces eubayanus]KOG98760.1 PAN6-like protein [Saccharomyces eubayanus]